MDEYTVRLAAFNGPMALLMHLIDKNKIDIYDIPISELTRQYMEYLSSFREFNIDVASSFLVMAATLLQIKSRLMLPRPPKEEDAEETDEDPRADLVRRLLEYKQFQQVSEVLTSMQQREEKFFSRRPESLPSTRLPPKDIPLALLVRAFKNALKEASANPTVPEIIVRGEAFSIKNKMRELVEYLTKAEGSAMFGDLLPKSSANYIAELIAVFLALLELTKLKKIRILQNNPFDDIKIVLQEGLTEKTS